MRMYRLQCGRGARGPRPRRPRGTFCAIPYQQRLSHQYTFRFHRTDFYSRAHRGDNEPSAPLPARGANGASLGPIIPNILGRLDARLARPCISDLCLEHSAHADISDIRGRGGLSTSSSRA